MSVDVRTRMDGPVELIDPERFFEHDLAVAFDDHRELLERAVRALAPPPLVVEVGSRSWTLTADEGRVRLAPGAAPNGGPHLVLDVQQLTDLAHDQVTVVGWQTNGTLDQRAGRFDDLLDWWMLIRGALDAISPHVAGRVALVDADGAPLDLTRSFPADAPLAEMGDFLRRAGFLHVTGVFTEAEMDAVSTDMDRAAPMYTAGDGRSWWAGTADGVQHLVRMQYFDEVSPAVETLVRDDRLQRLGGLTDDGHVYGAMDSNRIEALFKPLGVVNGISDIPWHKDCALGRHSYECCSMTVGISVTGADAVSGQLRVVAGSHRALVWPSMHSERRSDLPAIDLPTRTGDLTIHLSCTLHMAQPPVERERRVLYTGFRLPPRGTEAEREARERLRSIREDAPLKAPAAR